jgi:hypothetical protein
VHGLKLCDKADLIPVDNVSTTTFEKPPDDILRFSDGSIRMMWRDNKVFYDSPYGQKEYSLQDRINSVVDFGGILHMKSGAKYVVRQSIIIGIGIHLDILIPYKNIPKMKIQKKFGRATKVEEQYEEIDGELWHTTYFYQNRNMVISFFEPDNEIDYINIGEFPYSVDDKPFF